MGIRSVRAIVECAREIGISYLTLYAFSSENWGRPQAEVSTLMGLLREFLVQELPDLNRHGIRLNVIGEVSQLPSYVRKVLDRTLAATAGNSDMTLSLALSYAGRDEIVRAARKLAADAASGKIVPDSITDEAFAGMLDTVGIPDPDLVIRTSGEVRISNFLLWQAADAEVVFSDILWPAFGKPGVLSALPGDFRPAPRFRLPGEQDNRSPGDP